MKPAIGSGFPVHDSFVVPLFEILLVAFWIAATVWDYRRRRRPSTGIKREVERGEQGMGIIHMLFGAAVFTCIQMLSQTEVFNGYRAILNLMNLGILVHLFYFNNGWRNVIVGWYGRLRKER